MTAIRARRYWQCAAVHYRSGSNRHRGQRAWHKWRCQPARELVETANDGLSRHEPLPSACQKWLVASRATGSLVEERPQTCPVWSRCVNTAAGPADFLRGAVYAHRRCAAGPGSARRRMLSTHATGAANHPVPAAFRPQPDPSDVVHRACGTGLKPNVGAPVPYPEHQQRCGTIARHLLA